MHSHTSTQTKHHTYNIKTNLKKNKLKYTIPFPFPTSKPPSYTCMLRCTEPNFLLQLHGFFFFLLPFETVSFFKTKLAYSSFCLRLASNSRLISFLSQPLGGCKLQFFTPEVLILLFFHLGKTIPRSSLCQMFLQVFEKL